MWRMGVSENGDPPDYGKLMEYEYDTHSIADKIHQNPTFRGLILFGPGSKS